MEGWANWGRFPRLIMQNAIPTRGARVEGLCERLLRETFAGRKTYCNPECSCGAGKKRRVQGALESLWENFTRACLAAGVEVSFFSFFLYFVREAAACETATFSRGVFGPPESALATLKALHCLRPCEGIIKRCHRVVFLQV